MICQKCGKEITKGGKFCDSCGAEICNDIANDVQGTVPPPIQRNGQTSAQDTLNQDDAKKKKQTLIGAITVALGLFAIIIGLSVLFGGNKTIKLVKTGYFVDWPKITIEEAFEDYFDSTEWDSYKEDGETYVKCTGKRKYEGENTKIKITFEVDGDEFEVVSVTLNGSTYTDANTINTVLYIIYED